MHKGHVSVVIGATSGVGRALALELAARGGTVAVVGRNLERLESTLAALEAAGGDGHTAFSADVRSAQDMERLAGECRAAFGRVDFLAVSVVATTGGDGLPPQVRDLSLADWQNTLDVNLHGVFLANKVFLPMMLEAESGIILNVGSALSPQGMKGQPHSSAYSASKFAVAAMSKALNEETEERGVRVMAVYPGAVRTPLIEGSAIDAAFGGAMTPESLADAIVQMLTFADEGKVMDPYLMPMRVRGGRGGR